MSVLDGRKPDMSQTRESEVRIAPPAPVPRAAHPAVVNGEAAAQPGPSLWRRLRPYAAIARPDHWFKNVFMALGVVLAYFYYHPYLLGQGASTYLNQVLTLGWAVAVTCIVASSNYVLNEILDAPTDRSHPVKRHRPIPSGRVRLPLAYAEWIALGVLGLAAASTVSLHFFYSALFLLVMGVIYNVPPVRSKELPYLDVLSESINNPIRLLLGWYAVTATLPKAVYPQEAFPPVSLLIAYWMIGAFFMAAKRFAEYRSLADSQTAGAYRRSFRFYDEPKLLISMFFYVTTFALFLGIFIIRYKLELILVFPLVAGFTSYYLHIAFKKESAVQNPEHLYKEKGLMIYLAICVAAFFVLMFCPPIDELHRLFNVETKPAKLWEF
jgi:4-hydroxybenzoate polyprenyltransferase